MKRAILTLAFLPACVLWASPLCAHVPYFEHCDFSMTRPFRVESIVQSIAAYSWLEIEDGRTDDVDVYAFKLTGPTRVFVESLVPVCAGYEEFLPAFAVVGPGLPEPQYDLPIELPPGYGAVVVENLAPGQERPVFYEFFGDKCYYDGPEFDQVLDVPGEYCVVYWDPYAHGGDYVAVLGYEETWRLSDILRALIYTPLIRMDLELHTCCLPAKSE